MVRCPKCIQISLPIKNTFQDMKELIRPESVIFEGHIRSLALIKGTQPLSLMFPLKTRKTKHGHMFREEKANAINWTLVLVLG